MEISKMITLSSKHLSRETMSHLEDGLYNVRVYAWENVSSYEAGLLLLVPLNVSSCVPCDLGECFKFAKDKGADWIMFKDNFPPVNTLSQYEI